MTMQIKIENGVSKTLWYHGDLILPDRTDDGSYRFSVQVHYFSKKQVELHKLVVGSPVMDITWEERPPEEDFAKAQQRIEELILKLMEEDNEN